MSILIYAGCVIIAILLLAIITMIFVLKSDVKEWDADLNYTYKMQDRYRSKK